MNQIALGDGAFGHVAICGGFKNSRGCRVCSLSVQVLLQSPLSTEGH